MIVLFSIPPQHGGSLMAPVNGRIMAAMLVVIAHGGVRPFGGPPRSPSCSSTSR
jgi:hypothetical protein